ncbi:RimK-like protein [Bradyrhizobium sp. ISRA443]|uniref:ATP-grasp domain-containing protein n=1 Tax=unclassified Bradyrhizobium TaxID=2631580 RepID=UPI00247A3584|nr:MULTISPECIES: RimK-like protein [unclassified Bradyrhizobium]WGR94191.1 RimK-like protein [Bradyrhizobium sp. ISRA435]WGR98872.1 RimK-like protein [Bradyrhizobium sp. ISRA436]WGS05763.1 RimK-like protein [Bradyrhizobium sp. ISRA437]WGS12649.1 RimK-like protein [Bradyrhizobium sp. ISRA443]
MVLISQRLFLETIKKYCLAHNIAIEIRSGGWLVIMQRGAERRLAIGYDVGLNSAVAHQIANDKAACAEVLATAGVAAIPHTLFLGARLSPHIPGSGSMEAMLRLLDAHPRGLVVKPNEGTSGELVFRVTTKAQLEQAVARILAAHPSLAISPYVEIADEVRVVLLDDRALIVYSKMRPQVTGDGVHSLRELVRSAVPAGQLETVADDFEIAELDAVPPAGERRTINWRHNLDSGAAPVLLMDGATREACIALAIKAAQALRIRFASIDVVHADGAWQILEVNSGVKMEALGKRHPELVEAAYWAAMDEAFA